MEALFHLGRVVFCSTVEPGTDRTGPTRAAVDNSGFGLVLWIVVDSTAGMNIAERVFE
jgi:hypothetical protein